MDKAFIPSVGLFAVYEMDYNWMVRDLVLPFWKMTGVKKLPNVKALSFICRPFGTDLHYVF